MRRLLAPATLLAIASLLALATLRALTTPAWPDDWDGIGFVASVTRYDLDRFVPHPPGYPVYVALLRIASVFTSAPMRAANSVAVTTGIVAVVFLARAAARWIGAARAAWVAAFVAFAPLVWRASTAVGSEAPALAFASAALFGISGPRKGASWWIGLSVGLGLGVRLSWAPLLLTLIAFAPSNARLRTLVVASGATLAWLVPFVVLVGPTHLLALARAHATGHFTVWGGSAISEPEAGLRVTWLARDLFVDGLGVDRDPLGAAMALLGLGLTWHGFVAWRRGGYPHARAPLALLPYAGWIALGQNLHQQPRHALPLVVALAGVVALAATTSTRARATGAALFVLLVLRTGEDAYARLTIPPPGEQLARFTRSLPGNVAAFGGPSARFFELHSGAVGVTVSTLGEVRLALTRLPSLPSRALVTSEVEGLATSQYPLEHLATFCRPARIERRAPCLDVFDWKAPFLKR